MTDGLARVFVDVHSSKAKLTLFCEGNYFLIALSVSANSLQQMSRRVVVDSSTMSDHNDLYDCRSWRFDIAFRGKWAKTHSNMRLLFHVSWWNSEVSKSLAASLERFVYHFGQYGSIRMSNMNFLCELTVVIPRHHCVFRMAKADSSTIEQVK